MMHLLRLSIILESFSSLHVVLEIVNPRLANCDSLVELGQSSMSAIISRFIAACQKRRISFDLKYFGVLHIVLSRRKLSCEQFSSPFSLTTFTTHSSNVDWCMMMAWTLSAKILSCVTDKWNNQYFAILLRSSMNLMFHFPRFLCICNHYCFAGIVVATICTPPIVEGMFVFLLYERVHPVHFHVLFFLLPFQLSVKEKWSRVWSTE